MPKTFDDFITDHGDTVKEKIVTDLGSIEPGVDQVKKYFPGLKLNESPYVTYFPFRLCSSFPIVNERGRFFTPKVLENSFRSLEDQMINYEHQISENYAYAEDTVIGSVKAVRFMGDTIDIGRQVAEAANIPPVTGAELSSIRSPVSIMGLGSLFRRTEKGQKILESYISKKSKWGVSMECAHKWTDAWLLYDGKFFPFKEADTGMIDCIQVNGIRPYNGKPLRVAVGGAEGSIHFHGLGMTASPADPTGDILCFAGGQCSELSSKKTFFMPFQSFQATSLELANIEVDKKITELASIVPLGETQESDGHTHLILSNLQVVPELGHTHHLSQFVINRGTKPTLTAITETHADYPRSSDGYSSSESRVHSHLVNIPLSGKFTGRESDSEISLPTDPELASIESLGVEEMKRKLSEISTELASVNKELADTKDENKKLELQKKIGELTNEIASSVTEEDTKKLISDEIDKRIKEGTLLTREQANTEVEEATKKLEEAKAEELRINNLKADRLKRLSDIGIDTSFELEDIKDSEGKPLTIQQVIEGIGYDEQGERAYLLNFNAFKLQAEALKKQKEDEQQKLEAEKQEVVQGEGEGQSKEAASKKKTMLLHAGKTSSDEGRQRTVTPVRNGDVRSGSKGRLEELLSKDN